jgi:hypothetical protein
MFRTMSTLSHIWPDSGAAVTCNMQEEQTITNLTAYSCIPEVTISNLFRDNEYLDKIYY